jgi:hypothetical protein
MNDGFDRWLDETLSAAPPPAPEGFAARVMARVAVTAQERPRLSLDTFPLAPALPWWVRATFEPASVLATVVAAILLWRGAALSGLVAAASNQLVGWLGARPLTVPVAPLWLEPTTLAATALAAAPLLLLLARQLYRWSADLVGPRSVAIRTR